MNRRIRGVVLFFVWSMGTAATAPVLAMEESLTLDPATGNYRLRYEGDDGNPIEVMWVPPTKVKSAIRSRALVQPDGTIRYQYSVSVETGSPQPLAGFSFDASQAFGTETNRVYTNIPHGVPPGWEGVVSTSLRAKGLLAVWWSFSNLNSQGSAGLQAGEKQGGFYVISRDLPGVGTARMEGAMPTQGFLGEGPGESEVGLRLREIDMGYVPRFAAIPRILNPAPFNAVVVLGSVQKHVKDDMASMQLIDPTLLGLIDRSLTQAIAAAQGGNTSSLRNEIKNLRQLLKQEHADVDKDDDWDDEDKKKKTKPRIDKLAARVLDFDLKYVEKRVKGDKD